MKGFSGVVLGSFITFFTLSTVAVAADSTNLGGTQPTEIYAPVGNIVTAPRGIQTYYPDQTSTSASPYTTDPAYLDSLPSCPADPSDGTVPKAPICPDVNKKWTQNFKDTTGTLIYQGGAAYNADGTPTPTLTRFCPELCTSTRYIHFTTAQTTTGSTYNRVDQYKPAICPPGYSQVAATKSDFDVSFTNGTIYLIPTSDAQRINYENQGATCMASSTLTYASQHYCSYANDFTTKSQTNNCSLTVNGGYGIKYKIDGTATYGIWTSCQTVTAAHQMFGCYQPNSSSCTIALVPPSPTAPTTCAASSQGYSTKFANVFASVICGLPPGYYLSTNTVPTQVVCSRVRTVWQKQE